MKKDGVGADVDMELGIQNRDMVNGLRSGLSDDSSQEHLPSYTPTPDLRFTHTIATDTWSGKGKKN